MNYRITLLFIACIVAVFVFAFDFFVSGFSVFSDLDTPAGQWFVLGVRSVQSLCILGCGYQAYQLSKLFQNPRIVKLFYKIGVVLTVFFGFRILAAGADRILFTDIGWISLLVNLTFWAILFYRSRSTRVSLEKHVLPETKQSLSVAISNVMDEMRASKKRSEVPAVCL